MFVPGWYPSEDKKPSHPAPPSHLWRGGVFYGVMMSGYTAAMRLILIALFFIVLILFVTTRARPMSILVSERCRDALYAFGLDVPGGSPAVGEVHGGVWSLWGEQGGRAWRCEVREVWWGAQLEGVTIDPP